MTLMSLMCALAIQTTIATHRPIASIQDVQCEACLACFEGVCLSGLGLGDVLEVKCYYTECKGKDGFPCHYSCKLPPSVAPVLTVKAPKAPKAPRAPKAPKAPKAPEELAVEETDALSHKTFLPSQSDCTVCQTCWKATCNSSDYDCYCDECIDPSGQKCCNLCSSEPDELNVTNAMEATKPVQATKPTNITKHTKPTSGTNGTNLTPYNFTKHSTNSTQHFEGKLPRCTECQTCFRTTCDGQPYPCYCTKCLEPDTHVPCCKVC